MTAFKAAQYEEKGGKPYAVVTAVPPFSKGTNVHVLRIDLRRRGLTWEQFATGVRKWLDGALIQDALPKLSDEEREFFLSGMPLEEQRRFFDSEDNPMKRRTRRNPKFEDAALFQEVLAYLRALQWLYWTTHWITSGEPFYGDHLLLQRLYEGEGGPDINEEIDGIGERMVAYFGPGSVDPGTINRRVQSLVEGVEPREVLDALLNIEMGLQTAIRRAWKANQDSGEQMSLGIDDFLMALASEREVAIYLLRQRLGGRPPIAKVTVERYKPGLPFAKPPRFAHRNPPKYRWTFRLLRKGKEVKRSGGPFSTPDEAYDAMVSEIRAVTKQHPDMIRKMGSDDVLSQEFEVEFEDRRSWGNALILGV